MYYYKIVQIKKKKRKKKKKKKKKKNHHGGWFNFVGILDDERFIPLASLGCRFLCISNHGWTS